MGFAVRYHQWIIEEFAPALGPDVAEVGAGIGSVSEMLLRLPIKHLHAYEPSGNLHPVLAERLAGESRATVVPGFFPGDSAPASFDTVLYLNVLEHIEDDLGELQRARAALRPGGRLLVFVPALSWLYSELDREMGHCRRYEREGLRALVGRAGFRIERLDYFDVVGIVPWYLAFVLLKRRLGAGKVSLYDRLVVPLMRHIEQRLRPPIGKNLLLVAFRD